MSDELDIAFDRTTCIMGSTDITVDQVGSGGSTAMERDSWPMRRVAAEARRVLLDMASVRLGVPAAGLVVSNAVITAQADASKHVTYGELIAGKKFNVTLTGDSVYSVTGQARTKSVPELKYTGQPLQRDDIPAKVDGSQKWATGVTLPGMVHARNVKPPFACAKLTGIDEASVKSLPGFIKVMSKGNYVAVVCEREEQAVRAARQLKTTWEKPATAPFPASDESVRLHAHRDSDLVTAAECDGRSGRCVLASGQDRRGGVPGAVPGAYRVRRRPCHGGPVERTNDRLFQRHEDLRHAARCRRVPGYAAGQSPRRLHAGSAGLRPHGGGGRRVRGRLDRARARSPRPDAVDAR